MRERRPLRSSVCWVSARPISHGDPACVSDVSGDAPVLGVVDGGLRLDALAAGERADLGNLAGPDDELGGLLAGSAVVEHTGRRGLQVGERHPHAVDVARVIPAHDFLGHAAQGAGVETAAGGYLAQAQVFGRGIARRPENFAIAREADNESVQIIQRGQVGMGEAVGKYKTLDDHTAVLGCGCIGCDWLGILGHGSADDRQ